jgi:hypothetical protein
MNNNNNFTTFGRSGCRLTIKIEENIVNKTSNSIIYNDRLYLQFIKQSQFQEIFNLTTPKTFKFQSTDILHNFDMEYIHGQTFEEFCLYSNINEIDKFVVNIISYLKYNINNSIYTEINFNKLKNKLILLKNNINFKLDNYFNYLLNNPIEYLPIGKCHGDLTMSNIIFAEKYYLIDFLDNPYETPFNDIIKIKQDSQHEFYFRLLNRTNTKVKLCLDYINKQLDSSFENIINIKEFIWLSIFNLLRILPYLKDEEEIKTILVNLKTYEYYITSRR